MARASLAELRDPLGWLLAALTLGAAWVAQPRWWLAVLAPASALLVKSLSAAVLTPRPREEAVAALQGLSRREVQIARQVSEGLTNKEIAARLFISERTVDNHVQHILNKLDFRSRAQIARWAAEQGLISQAEK